MDILKGYTSIEAEEKLAINYDYKQVFHHDFNPGRTMAEYGIIRAYTAQEPAQRQVGLVVVDFLRSFGFATRKQLEQLLILRGVPYETLDEVLDSYVNLRIMNYFMAAAFEMEEIPDDALRIYCLDYGATFILSHFASANMVGWLSTDSIRPIRLVVMYLATVRFFLSLTESKCNDLHYFRPLPDINIGKRISRFSADFQIKSGYTERSFILEVLRSGEFPVDWMKKVDQIEAFLRPGVYTRYYREPPVFILLAENKDVALEASIILNRRLPDAAFRVTTDEEMQKGVAKARFYKLVPETDDKPARLAAVRASLFSSPKKETA